MDEKDAIERCRLGDLDGLGVLFAIHRDAVMRTAYAILRNKVAAEDVTQDVFVHVFRSIRGYDANRPFRPWLHRIAANLSISELRRQNRRGAQLEEAEWLPSPDMAPDEQAIQSEASAALWHAIGALSPEHRMAVVLRYYHGFNEAEMALAMHCRKGTVKSRLHNALKKLGETLPAEFAEDADRPNYEDLHRASTH